jgi:hypothetical protein
MRLRRGSHYANIHEYAVGTAPTLGAKEMQTFIKSGHGFAIGQNFSRAIEDTAITLSPSEYAKPGHVIGYIAGNPDHPLGFMRHAQVRVHVRRDCLTERK